MFIFHITVCLGGGNNIRFSGLFASNQEAQDQTWADYPTARAVSVINIKGASNA